jgi:dTDP-4-dehydrorhamnose reductase
MLGNVLFRFLVENSEWRVFGTIRSEADRNFFSTKASERLVAGVDARNFESIIKVFNIAQPNVVINCIGLIKQLTDADDPLEAIPINSLLPHRLAKLCEQLSAKLFHISTDCVFSGDKGMYNEMDYADAKDLYGRSKLLGEVDYGNSVTLRTSIIGPELKGAHGLLEWFLSQSERCPGYTRAKFSGVPTIVLAYVIRDIFIMRPDLHGIYHVASKPITKFDLLQLIAEIYGKKIKIVPTGDLVIDRSLDPTALEMATGYVVADWPELIKLMYEFG